MDTVERLFQLAIMVGVVWMVAEFYWMTVGFCVLVLASWFVAVIGFPAYLFIQMLSEGNWLAVIVLPFLVAMLGGFWFITARAAWSWYQKEQQWSTFWKPWNARTRGG